MNRFYVNACIALLFCVFANAQQTTTSFEDPLIELSSLIEEFTSTAAVLDTADFTLHATRTNTDSTLYTYSSPFNREGLFIRQDNTGSWYNFSIINEVFNEMGLVIERTESLYENDSCCIPNSRYTTGYNEYNMLNYQLSEIYVDEAWENDTRWIYEFNDQGRPIHVIGDFWEENQWKPENNRIFVYDDLDNLIYSEELFNNLSNGSRKEWEFNDNNQLVLKQEESYDSGVWTLSSTETYTYNDEGQLITSFKDYPEGGFDIPTQITYEYDSLGNNVFQLIEVIIDNVISLDSRVFIEFDDQGNLNEALRQRWENGAWKNTTQTTRIYNEYGNFISSEYFTIWQNGEWQNGNRNLYNFTDAVDLNGNLKLISFYFDIYSPEGWSNNFYQINYYDATFLGIEDALLTHSPLNIYPNPTQGIFQLAVDDVFKNNGVLEVFNLDGQLILRQNLLSSPQISVDLREVSNGLYVVKLTNGVQQATSLLQVK